MQDLCLSAGQAHPCQPGRAQGVSIEYIAEHNCKNSVHFWTLVCLQVEKKQEAEATIGGKINGFNGSSKHTTLECPAFLIPCCVLSHCRSSIHTIYRDVFFFFLRVSTHTSQYVHTHTLWRRICQMSPGSPSKPLHSKNICTCRSRYRHLREHEFP